MSNPRCATEGSPSKPPEAARCGLCVHRNGGDTYKRAFCTPKGWRMRDDAPCDHFFTKDQLNAPLYGKPLTEEQKYDGVLF